MSAIGDLKPLLDGIAAEVATTKTGVDSVLAKLAALQAGGTLSTADQAALDAAIAEGQGISTSLGAINAELAPPAP